MNRVSSLRGRIIAGIRGSRSDLVAALVYAAVSLLLYATCLAAHKPGADGFYGWIYARSLAYDGDLDFTNDYALCGDPWSMGWETATHHRANVFYIGPAVFWTPAIWLLKHFVHGEPNVAGGAWARFPRWCWRCRAWPGPCW